MQCIYDILHLGQDTTDDLASLVNSSKNILNSIAQGYEYGDGVS